MDQLKITMACLFSLALMGWSALAGAQEITRYNEGNYFNVDHHSTRRGNDVSVELRGSPAG